MTTNTIYNTPSVKGKAFAGGHQIVGDFVYASECRVIIIAINWDEDNASDFDPFCPHQPMDRIEIRIDWDGEARTALDFRTVFMTLSQMETLARVMACATTLIHDFTIQRRIEVQNDRTKSYYYGCR